MNRIANNEGADVIIRANVSTYSMCFYHAFKVYFASQHYCKEENFIF